MAETRTAHWLPVSPLILKEVFYGQDSWFSKAALNTIIPKPEKWPSVIFEYGQVEDISG